MTPAEAKEFLAAARNNAILPNKENQEVDETFRGAPVAAAGHLPGWGIHAAHVDSGHVIPVRVTSGQTAMGCPHSESSHPTSTTNTSPSRSWWRPLGVKRAMWLSRRGGRTGEGAFLSRPARCGGEERWHLRCLFLLMIRGLPLWDMQLSRKIHIVQLGLMEVFLLVIIIGACDAIRYHCLWMKHYWVLVLRD